MKRYCRRLQEYPNASKVLGRARSGSSHAAEPREGAGGGGAMAAAAAESEDMVAKVIVKLLNTLYKNLPQKKKKL